MLLVYGQNLGGNVSAISEATTYFPHSQFKIPFNVDARGTVPAQVQLWVSTDEGATWQMHGTATADRRSFDFRAAAEGLYLFAVQTVDETGKAFPSTQPPMRILIDTSKPQLSIKSDVNAAGQVVVDIRISEEHLKTDSVRLSYRTDQHSEWQELTVENLVEAGDVYEGQVVLDVKNCREIGFVVTASDEASNIGKASTQFSMPRTAAAEQDIKFASQRTGSGVQASQGTGLTPTPGAVAWPANQPPVVGNFQTRNVPIPTQGPSQAQPEGQLTRRPAQENANGIRSGQPPVAGNDQGGWQVTSQQSTRKQSTHQQSTSQQAVGQLANSNGNSPSTFGELGLSLDPPQASGVNQSPSLESPTAMEELPAPQPIDTPKPYSIGDVPTGRQFVDTQRPGSDDSNGSTGNTNAASKASDAVPPALPGTTPGLNSMLPNEIDTTPLTQAYHCNSRSFSLDYELNAAAGSLLADIELWGTEDGGTTWQKWGADPDRQSPFDVQVGNDGLFGFRMVIVSQNGNVSNRPKDGDSADSWINVDTERPGGKITKAVYGEGREAGMLVIDYTCSDNNLHERPVTLSYSETRNGPWITIATGLKNSGNYLWKADPNLPRTVFLRLEIVDKAGNVGSHLLDLPINIQGLMPRGRIQGFRPINGN
jgi:hypothetical protein